MPILHDGEITRSSKNWEEIIDKSALTLKSQEIKNNIDGFIPIYAYILS